MDENEVLRIAAPGVLSNDSDVDGAPITAILFSSTSHGSLELFSDGSFTYMPDANYSGPDFFSYRANDGILDSIVATVRITVNVVDTTPPPPPELIEPDDAAVTDATPIFRWSEVTDPSGVSYELQVAKDLAFTPPLVINEATDATSFTVPDVQALEVGQYFWRVRAKDGAGNTGEFSVIRRFTVPPPVVLQSITVLPRGIYFAQLDADKPLAVTGHFSDGTTRDLTPGSAGTTYESSNRFVAKVSADGVVTSAGNGSTTIAVRHQGFSANVTVNVEVGVTLQALQMTPESVTLRSAGVAEQLSVNGAFSDDSIKDLTAAATGTVYESSHPSVATVSPDGLVTAHAHGVSTITASNAGLSDTTRVTVAISAGQGFLRGEVYNDALSLPLVQSAIVLLADGSGPLTPPITTIADGQGRFLLPGMEGDALVRVDKAGFTSVERRGSIPQNTALTLLDARLTPLDSRLNLVTSALGGQAHNAAKTITLDFPPGSLEADADIRLTAISGQGLLGTLPPGWSPIAAVDVQPAGLGLAQAATLRASSGAGIPSGTTLVAALYDSVEHTWIALGGAAVSSDGVTIEHPLMRTGQIAFLWPDPAPFEPPAPIVGSPLEGIGLVPIPSGATANGHVTPRASPAGEGARAAGNVVLQSPGPLPSGTVVQARVRQRFDLLTGASVVPSFFVEDLVLYAHPRTGTPNSLSATFPITPSLTFGILQLSLGVVHLDVAPPGPAIGGDIVGPAGGTVADAEGDAVSIPAGALSQSTAAELFRLDAAELPLAAPVGLELLAALELELREPLSQTASLTIPRPAGLADDAQVVVAQVISDPSGVRRMKIVALGQVGPDSVVTVPSVSGTPLGGVTGGGLYLFLRPSAALGFVFGKVFTPGGASPAPLALVTSDTAPFGDVTGADGGYLVAGGAGTNSVVTASNRSTGDSTSAIVPVEAQNAVASLDLTLGVVGPFVISDQTTPAPGAVDVLVNAPISVRFSEPIKPQTVTPQSARLELNGALVPVQRVLSPDGLRLALIPDEQLKPLSHYALVLTGDIQDSSNNGLVPFTFSFTTIDTSKPPQPEAGQILAGLPDQDGMVLVFGTHGTAEPATGVTATNLRTQETATVLAITDGSFRLRLPAAIGDELALTFRNQDGKQLTIPITQLEDPDGSTGLGRRGGSVKDSEGRVGRVLPSALAEAAIFRLVSLNPAALPVLPSGFEYADSFELEMRGGAFNRLRSLELAESQNRFAPVTDTSAPFEAEGDFFVPLDFLVNGKLNFAAEARDAAGFVTGVNGSTTVVAANPDASAVELGSTGRFPTVFLSVPRQSQPNGQVQASAIAPTARVDFDLPAPASVGDELLLARLTELGGSPRLAVVDRLNVADMSGSPALVTAGRELPGAAGGGRYAVVSSASTMAFITGRITGPAAIVSVDGLPFVFEASEPNAAFSAPVLAGQPFSLTFIDSVSGAIRGTASGQAPASGSLDVGEPLGAAAGQLQVSTQPDANSLVDIGDPIVFDFSEPLDSQTLNANNIAVTDPLGNRIFGRFALSDGDRRVTFTPLRRWRYGQTVRYAVSARVLGLSGARLPQTFSSSFTTFAPVQTGSVGVGEARDVALFDTSALVGTDDGLATLDLTNLVVPALLDEVGVAGGVSGVAALAGVSFSDRNGAPIEGAIALVASGDEAAGGFLHIFDVNAPKNLAQLGSAPLPGPGVPRAAALGADNTTLVAIQSVGIQEVRLPLAIPEDPANPGGALGKRFPATGSEGVNDLAILRGRVIAVGENGLTILNAETFELLGNVSTEGDAQGLAVLADFSMDANGDGTIDALSEVFDLAVVANGADGLVQLYNISDVKAPRLVGVVRLNGPANGVSLDRERSLAYIGSGLRGVVIVDLTGPASVQPIDFDRNSVDDRILGVVDTAGTAGRLALDPSRAAALVADGANGVVVLQVAPPTAKFGEVQRDPIAATTGDQQPAGDPAQAFLTDDAIQVELNAVIPPFESLFLRLEEIPASGGPTILTFPGGGATAPLSGGLNILTIEIDKSQASQGSAATLKAQDALGRTLARIELAVVPPDAGGATPESLFLVPDRLLIPEDTTTAQLAVGGVFADGRIFNLTSSVARHYLRRAKC